MPIYDNNGTTNALVYDIYDNNGANVEINEVYDNNGTTSYLDFKKKYPLVTNDTPIVSWTDDLKITNYHYGYYDYTRSDVFVATSAKIDVSNYNTLTLDFANCYTYPDSNTIGTLYFGISNDQTTDAFVKSKSVSITGIRGGATQDGTITIDVSAYTGAYYVKIYTLNNGRQTNSSHTVYVEAENVNLIY